MKRIQAKDIQVRVARLGPESRWNYRIDVTHPDVHTSCQLFVMAGPGLAVVKLKHEMRELIAAFA